MQDLSQPFKCNELLNRNWKSSRRDESKRFFYINNDTEKCIVDK